MFMMYVMHHAFRRDLSALTEAAQCTPAADRVAWRLLQQRWQVFAEALHGHHSGEDAGLWPLLLERGTDDDVETLEAMEAEHAEFEPLLEACEDGFARLAEHADDDARAALAVRLAATRECLARHLEHEETGAIPIIQRLLTPGGLGAPRRGALQGGPVPGQDRADRAVGGGRRAARRARPRVRQDRVRLQARLAGDPSPVRRQAGPRLPARRLSRLEGVPLARQLASHEAASGISHSAHNRAASSACRVARSRSPVARAAIARKVSTGPITVPDPEADGIPANGSSRSYVVAARSGRPAYNAASAAMLSTIVENHQSGERSRSR